MNTLSWLIYAAGAAGNMQFISALVGVVGGITLGVVSCIAASEGGYEGRTATIINRLWMIVAALIFTAAILPSRTTVYAIAASEMGETALKTETGGKAVKALNAWLDRQIADDKSDGEK